MRPRVLTPISGHPIIGRLGEPRDPHRIHLRGPLTPDRAGEVWSELRRETQGLARGERLEIDLSHVDAVDGRTMALLVAIRTELAGRGVTAELTGGNDRIRALLELYRGDAAPPRRRRRRRPEGFLAQIGRRTVEMAGEVKGILGFVGATVRAFGGVLRHPRSGNWKDVFPTMERCGADAVPIVLLINFLVGFVLAYQASTQLEQFGADIYVAHLVGLSMTREMAPLMTAIILCGRSGAAFAAELGTMKVGEEIDALRTMGFGPIRWLVLPRMLALVLVMPLLTLLADVIGIVGGFVGGAQSLDITAYGYLQAIQGSVDLWDVATGVLKSVAFAIAIALIACQQGFATTGGAEGVGRRTTASVVSILFALILIDTGFTVFFEAFEL